MPTRFAPDWKTAVFVLILVSACTIGLIALMSS